MKAEEIKFEILGIPYTKSTLTEMVKTYARIQIEKDRERVKKNAKVTTKFKNGKKWITVENEPYEFNPLNFEMVTEINKKSIDETPIILD